MFNRPDNNTLRRPLGNWEQRFYQSMRYRDNGFPYWDFKIIGKVDQDGKEEYSVRQVFYDAEGKMIAYSMKPFTLVSGDVEELVMYLDMIKEAVKDGMFILDEESKKGLEPIYDHAQRKKEKRERERIKEQKEKNKKEKEK